MKFKLILICISLMLAVFAGCGEEEAVSEAKQQAPSEPEVVLPEYQVVETEDASFAKTKRFALRITVPSGTSKEDMLNVAEAEVEKLKSEQKLNAVGFFFYFDAIPASYIADATVDWAPEGDWSKADSVKAGDYSKHEFSDMK
ncbi:MAG: hypothetical protein IBX61_09240 [Thermoleophilia bacterium]|nr:hypothetical protein [Thermoleophilia bacterium]